MSETIVNNGNGILANSKKPTEDSVWIKSIRLAMNLFANILIFLTVFICLLFACSSVITLYHLHIILSVLGYQFVMCQGTLIMSKYNSWSVFIKRRYRRSIHWCLQIIAAFLVTTGAVLIIREKSTHFDSVHGKLGLAALTCCLTSLLNGVLVMYMHKIKCMNIFWIKFIHYITGISSLFLATGSLCAAFKYGSFTSWIGGDNLVTVLTVFTWLFTVVVSLDFWIVMATQIKRII